MTFALNGFAFASLASRVPAVRDALGLAPEQVGLLLLGVSTGALVAMPVSGVVVQRLGATRTILFFAAVNGVGLLVAAAAVGAGLIWVVVPALVAVGMGTGVWDAAMNLEGAAVEQRLGRAIMPRFHAGFSFGTMAGAGYRGRRGRAARPAAGAPGHRAAAGLPGPDRLLPLVPARGHPRRPPRRRRRAPAQRMARAPHRSSSGSSCSPRR